MSCFCQHLVYLLVYCCWREGVDFRRLLRNVVKKTRRRLINKPSWLFWPSQLQSLAKSLFFWEIFSQIQVLFQLMKLAGSQPLATSLINTCKIHAHNYIQYSSVSLILHYLCMYTCTYIRVINWCYNNNCLFSFTEFVMGSCLSGTLPSNVHQNQQSNTEFCAGKHHEITWK